MELSEPDRHYSADDLAALTSTPRRTIRYYIQLGLVDRPVGETRAAHYSWKHLGQLLEIRRLNEEGFSLERIGEILKTGDSPKSVAPPGPGSITVQSHLHLAPGLELVVEPGRANLNPEQLRHLARDVIAAYKRVIKE